MAVAAVGALAGCKQSGTQQNSEANAIMMDNTLSAPNEVEALPADESSATPSNQLVNGDDSPDVNDIDANSD